MFTPGKLSRSRLNALTMNYELVEAIKVLTEATKLVAKLIESDKELEEFVHSEAVEVPWTVASRCSTE